MKTRVRFATAGDITLS